MAPVLATALLIAIVVTLAGVIGFIVLDYQSADPPQPTASLEFQQQAATVSSYNVTVLHRGGDPLPAEEVSVKITDGGGDGTDTGTLSETLTSSESQVITSTVESGDIIRLVWTDPEGPTSKILAEYTVE